MKKCKFCMEEIDEKATICPHCRKKQKKSSPVAIIIVVVFLIIAAGVVSTVGPQLTKYMKSKDLSITNTKGSVDAYGQLVWEGDITNNGKSEQKKVKINISCYTPARELAGKAFTTIEYIKPGETLHFTANGLGQYDANISCGYEIE